MFDFRFQEEFLFGGALIVLCFAFVFAVMVVVVAGDVWSFVIVAGVFPLGMIFRSAVLPDHARALLRQQRGRRTKIIPGPVFALVEHEMHLVHLMGQVGQRALALLTLMMVLVLALAVNMIIVMRWSLGAAAVVAVAMGKMAAFSKIQNVLRSCLLDGGGGGHGGFHARFPGCGG